MSAASSEFQTLLAEARGGSAEASGRLLAAFEKNLKLAARSTVDPAVGRKESTSDLVQETLLRASRDLPDFRGSTEAELLAWLQTILRRQAANAVQRFRYSLKRQIAREFCIDGPDSRGDWRDQLIVDTPTPGAKAVNREEQRRLSDALQLLPEEAREAIRLHDFEQRSWEDVGRLLGRTPGAARSLWYRAILMLREQLRSADGQ